MFYLLEQYSKQIAAHVKRQYDSSRRQASAQATRQHIVETARDLFIDQGYEATSMRQLADAAGVSLQTIYNAFGSKFDLFSAVIDVVVAGDDEPVPLRDRPALTDLASVDDPDALIEALVHAATAVLERLSPIYPTLRAAAGSDPQVAAAHRHFTIEGRHDDLRAGAQRLADLGALPAHVDVDRATDIIWAVLSPDIFDLLVCERGWSVAELESWAIDSLASTLLARA